MLTFDDENEDECEKYAAALSGTLLQELSLGYPLSEYNKAQQIKKLDDEPPSRTALRFQQREGQDAAKHRYSSALRDNPSEDAVKEIFCMAHCEFSLVSGTDIEHAYAHSRIRENQSALLTFLNAHQVLAEKFLDQAGMNELFKRDAADSKVKGTRYFYQLCYNSIDNLWLLCHACNIKKNDGDSLDWFKSQKMFGQCFIDAVAEDGGLHNGVIIDRIYHLDSKKEDLLLEIETGRYIFLHDSPGEGRGLGEFVQSWFLNTYSEHYEQHRDFYSNNYALLKTQLREIQLSDDPVFVKKKYKQLKGDTRRLHIMHQALIEIGSQLSDSDSDDSERSLSKKASIRQQIELIKEARAMVHEQHKVTAYLDRNYGKEDSHKIWDNLKGKEAAIDLPEWKKFNAQVVEKIKECSGSPPDKKEMKALCDQFAATIQSKQAAEEKAELLEEKVQQSEERSQQDRQARAVAEQQVQQERQARAVAEQQAQQDRQQAQRDRQQAQQERQAREIAEQRAAERIRELEAQLAWQQGRSGVLDGANSFFESPMEVNSAESVGDLTLPEDEARKRRRVDYSNSSGE